MKMRRTLALALALAVTGCSLSVNDATDTTARRPAVQPSVDPYDAYLGEVRANSPLPFWTDDMLVGFADATCEAYDGGISDQDFVAMISEIGDANDISYDDQYDLAYAAGVALRLICPRNL
jgi:hypothetical protein